MAGFDKSKINELTLKYLLGTISTEEQQELNIFLDQDPVNRQRFAQRVQANNLKINLEAYREVGHRRMAGALPGIRTIFYRYVPYAAAIILIIGAAILWITGDDVSVTKQVSINNINKDILPGKNKATLTLADGTLIDLETAKSGTLTPLGASGVYKTDSTRIVYENNDINKKSEKPETNKDNKGMMTYNTLTTPRGGTFEVLLPDGSSAWLNAASSIRFPTSFLHGRREVDITGEVYFDIKPNSSEPFLVNARGGVVKVLGTEFNVQAYSNEPAAEITLVNGAVLVSTGKKTQQNDGGFHVKQKTNYAVRLEPGQQAQLTADGSVKFSGNVDVQQAIAWRAGFFKFSNADIRSILSAVERWYDIDIIYQTKDFSMKYGGRISRNLRLSELLRLLEANNIHHYKMEGRKLIVLP